MRSWRRSMREASQPSTKATGRPMRIRVMSKSIRRGCWGFVGLCGHGGQCGGCQVASLFGSTAMAPPAWHHAQHTNSHTGGKGDQYDQHHGRSPACAKEKLHGDIALVIQGKSEQGKKNGCFK